MSQNSQNTNTNSGTNSNTNSSTNTNTSTNNNTDSNSNSSTTEQQDSKQGTERSTEQNMKQDTKEEQKEQKQDQQEKENDENSENREKSKQNKDQNAKKNTDQDSNEKEKEKKKENKGKDQSDQEGQSDQEKQETQQDLPLTGDLVIDEETLRAVFTDCSDVIFHSFETSGFTSALCVYCVGLCDTERLERQVLTPVQEIGMEAAQVPLSSVKTVETSKEAAEAILEGEALLLLEGSNVATTYPLYKAANRSTEEPLAESTVRGARDGFTESLTTNLSLVRKRLKTPALKFRTRTVGESSNTSIALAYVEGIIDASLVKEVEQRLDRLRVRDILESQYIEEDIIDQRFSPFPQMIATERPDVVASNLMEGRFAILVDGTPFTLVAPVTLFSMLQSPEDYYQYVFMSVFLRWLRYVFYVLSLLLPSAYVAITTYHQEMIPTVLLLSIARAREEIPFPALVEALIMEIAFEALREAGVRLPKQVGSAVSIVGALIIGQAATTAGIVSAPMIIIVAITGIASFMIPRYSASISTRLLRFPIMILAGTLGLIGVMLGIILIVIHLSSLRSFGAPYLSPVAPTNAKGLKDLWWRPAPWNKPR
ncbi:spore germination protein KA [Paenibacillus polysaccharolyticus]|uniref:Spore germination protein KA n=1 Tax=Paenibacillus polysaccharolyticus TaxID=582692 RepID=A0A1G5CDH6_9BACL|nr:spore germination protein [Paenibacillus polysaccharolyticus]SCY00364.1 spore germination protein KA [Paenibacillus polysaccharolyticus]